MQVAVTQTDSSFDKRIESRPASKLFKLFI